MGGSLNLSNNEIEKIIQSTFEDKIERKIVHSRIIDGLPYDEILKECFTDEYCNKAKDKIIQMKIHPLINKLYKAVKLDD